MADATARQFSIRRRLLAALLGALSCVWLGIAAYSYLDARHEVDELLDAHLAQAASMVLAQADQPPGGIESAPALHKRARKVAFQVWEQGRVLRLRSQNAPEARLSPRDEGFSDVAIDGRDWRVFSGWDAARRTLVQVGERSEARREIAGNVALGLLVPLLVALPALGLLVWWSVTRSLAPLGRLGAEVAARRADDLRPLPAADVPQEVMPLVLSLNAMLARIAGLLEGERRFTADASHELRTPLAALKAQAQVARAAIDAGVRVHALDNVIAGCDRATRLVEQLLTLARIGQDTAAEGMQPCDLRELARTAVADLAPAAVAKGIDISLSAQGASSVTGQAGLLAILLRNVIDNAIRYSPSGCAVKVEVDAHRISVTDQGPGITPGERGKIGRRFYRVLGSGESGSGLGLSIAGRIAELHEARISLDDGDDGRGLRVSVVFAARGDGA